MKAQQIDMLIVGFGTDYALGTVDFHNAGLSTDKDAYTTKTKTATVANPYTLDANGRTANPIYGDGWYKLIITKADSTGVLTFDNLYYGVLEQTDERHPNVRAITTSDTILYTDDVILANASAGAIIATLDDAANFGNYQVVILKKQDATVNTVTLDGNGTQTIDGATTKVLSRQYETIMVVKISATQWAEIRVLGAANADTTDTFDASATPTASTIVVSEADGDINSGWLDKTVLADSTDTTHDYLTGKVDNTTIEVNTTTHQLRIKPTTGIGTSQLKNSSFEASSAGAGTNVAVTGGQWCHWPQIKVSDDVLSSGSIGVALDYEGHTYATIVYLANSGVAGQITYANFLYHTASGDQVWVFRLREKATKKTIMTTIGVDHPCFSSSGDPKTMPHPFVSYDPATQEILVSTPSWDEINKIIKDSGDRSVLETINIDYDIVEDKAASWPDKPIAIKGREDALTHLVTPTEKIIINKESYFVLCRLEKKGEIKNASR